MGRPKIAGYTVQINGVGCVSKNGVLCERSFLLPVTEGESPSRFEIDRSRGKAPVEATRQRIIRAIMRTNRLAILLGDSRYEMIGDTTTAKRLRALSGEWEITTFK